MDRAQLIISLLYTILTITIYLPIPRQDLGRLHGLIQCIAPALHRPIPLNLIATNE